MAISIEEAEKFTLGTPAGQALADGLLLTGLIALVIGVVFEAASEAPGILISEFENDSAVALTADVVSFELNFMASGIG